MKVKASDISKTTAATLIALSLALSSLLSWKGVLSNSDPAQNNTGSNGTVVDRTPFQESKDDNQHWGALGLLGILGLANLFRKDEPKRYRDPMGE